MARAGEYAIGVSFAFLAMRSRSRKCLPVKMVIPSKWVGYELEASGLMPKTAKNPTTPSASSTGRCRRGALAWPRYGACAGTGDDSGRRRL